MSNLYSNSIFWIDTDKIKPNPYQPRREFDEARLQDLADSIKQYGILQPLTVSRVEIEKEDGADKDYAWRWLRLRTVLGANSNRPTQRAADVADDRPYCSVCNGYHYPVPKEGHFKPQRG